MINATNRNNMFPTITVDGVTQKDISRIDFKDYDFGAVQYTMIREIELGRPDLLSLRLYGTPGYWWFILWFNGMRDPWHDLQPDTMIKYPSMNSINNAIRIYSKHNENE